MNSETITSATDDGNEPPCPQETCSEFIEINFGKSEWVLHRPPSDPTNYPDNIIRIPITGKLPQFRSNGYEFSEYDKLLPIKPELGLVHDYSSVTVSRPRTAGAQEDIELMLLWITERNEWIGIWHTTWNEAHYLDDDYFDGPFAIDQMCADKIQEAYNATPGKFTLEKVRRMSPEQITKELIPH